MPLLGHLWQMGQDPPARAPPRHNHPHLNLHLLHPTYLPTFDSHPPSPQMSEPSKKRQKLDPSATPPSTRTPLSLFLLGQALENEPEELDEPSEEPREPTEPPAQPHTTPQSAYLQIYNHHPPTTPYHYHTHQSMEPPANLVHSCACNSLGGFATDLGHIHDARKYFNAALESWPHNAMALINLGNMEREHGSVDVALQLYTRCNRLTVVEYSSNEEIEDPFEWEDAWICAPRRACIAKCTYLAALMLHQQQRGHETDALLRRFGVNWKISSPVWAAAMTSSAASAAATLPASSSASQCVTNVGPVVQYVPSVVPLYWSDRMRGMFRPSSPFWEETNYAERGYFSFWYDVQQRPKNVVEHVIQQYILPQCLEQHQQLQQRQQRREAHTGKTAIVGAEWWVHSRPLGRNLGHQLHFDTEENSLEEKHDILHPTVSSVCYLTGDGGGPTVVFDQTSNDVTPSPKAYGKRIFTLK
jgi:hypothetical protein